MTMRDRYAQRLRLAKQITFSQDSIEALQKHVAIGICDTIGPSDRQLMIQLLRLEIEQLYRALEF